MTKKILEILDEIGSDTKKTFKTSCLQRYKDNKTLLNVTRLALNPYINFFIKKIPDYEPTGTKDIDWALAELEKLSSRTVTGHAAINHLSHVLSSLDSSDATVISRVIGKDLRCGMAEGLVNAVIPDFIPTYPCLLARAYDAKNIKNIKYPAISQLKADGLRVNFHITEGAIMICGRSGREIDLLGALDSSLFELASQFDQPVVIDGELVVVDHSGNILPRKVGNGIINKAIKGTISKEEADMVRAQVWDVITINEFNAGRSRDNYHTRFTNLKKAIENIHTGESHTVSVLSGTNKYWIIPSKEVNSLAEAEEHFVELLNQGEEGTILKNYSGIWEDSRSKDLVKMKAEKDCDLEIIGWNPGTGQFEGQVGSLICASSDRKVVVSISGFSHKLRQEITDTINELIGTILAVTYNERIASEQRTDSDSLFLPRFAEFRSDKTVANSSDEIK